MPYAYWLLALFLTFSFSKSWAFDSIGSGYIDFNESFQTSTETCGDLCLQDQNYVDRFELERELSNRFINVPSFINLSSSDMNLYKNKEMALSFKANSNFSKRVLKRKIRWARTARNIGYGVSERGRDLLQSSWRELRRPLLNEVKDLVLSPYKRKKLSKSEKLEAWLIEQSVDSGASALELEAVGSSIDFSTFDFGINNYSLKYRPRVDPLKGRYGMRVRLKQYLTNSKVFFTNLSYNYCNSGLGFRDRRCGYLHSLSSQFSMTSLKRNLRWSLYLSYRTESLNKSIYVEDGLSIDHRPWRAGLQFSYAFYL